MRPSHRANNGLHTRLALHQCLIEAWTYRVVDQITASDITRAHIVGLNLTIYRKELQTNVSVFLLEAWRIWP